MEDAIKSQNNIVIENRKKISISGVTDVGRFDEEEMSIVTSYGELTVCGENLQIVKLSLETGDLAAEGDIISVTYKDTITKKSGFFSRLSG